MKGTDGRTPATAVTAVEECFFLALFLNSGADGRRPFYLLQLEVGPADPHADDGRFACPGFLLLSASQLGGCRSMA